MPTIIANLRISVRASDLVSQARPTTSDRCTKTVQLPRKGDVFSQKATSDTVYLANFNLWFMLLLIHRVATYITVKLSS